MALAGHALPSEYLFDIGTADAATRLTLSRSVNSSYPKWKLASKCSDLELLLFDASEDLAAPLGRRRLIREPYSSRRLDVKAAILARSGRYVGRQAQMIAEPRWTLDHRSTCTYETVANPGQESKPNCDSFLIRTVETVGLVSKSYAYNTGYNNTMSVSTRQLAPMEKGVRIQSTK